MRVMPSVTDTMVPTLRASVTDVKFSIRCLMRSLISVALMAIYQFLDYSLGRQLVGNAVEPRAQRAVDHQIPGAQDRATDQCRVRRAMQAHLPLQLARERLGQRELLLMVERRGGGD